MNNYASVGGTVTINDVSNATWNESADGNILNFADSDANTSLNIIGSPNTVNVDSAALVTVGSSSTVGKLIVSNTSANVTNSGTITTAIAPSGSITGGTVTTEVTIDASDAPQDVDAALTAVETAENDALDMSTVTKAEQAKTDFDTAQSLISALNGTYTDLQNRLDAISADVTSKYDTAQQLKVLSFTVDPSYVGPTGGYAHEVLRVNYTLPNIADLTGSEKIERTDDANSPYLYWIYGPSELSGKTSHYVEWSYRYEMGNDTYAPGWSNETGVSLLPGTNNDDTTNIFAIWEADDSIVSAGDVTITITIESNGVTYSVFQVYTITDADISHADHDGTNDL